jgi:NADPH2:quinone reductase
MPPKKAQSDMRAAAIDRFGGPSVLTPRTLPTPALKPTEVLIAVHTAGVAGWDAEMRQGWSPSGRPRFPWVLGTDGSGTAVATGARVRRFRVGDQVYASNFEHTGFYAQFVAVPASSTARIPSTLNLKHAGAIPITGITALDGIDRVLKVGKGQSIVIHGATGGVGSLALQFAKFRGARVLATATGKDGRALARRLGADEAVDGYEDDLTGAARAFAPDGLDAILALAGGDPLEALIEALPRGGKVAYPNGVEPKPKKRRGITVVAYDAKINAAQLTRLARVVDAAGTTVPIAATFPLDDAADAHRRLAKGHVLGKLVLRIR